MASHRCRGLLSIAGVAVLGSVIAACGSPGTSGSTSSSAASAVAPTYTVNVNDAAGATGGYVFFNEGTSPASAVVGQRSHDERRASSRVVIADKKGRVVWSRTAPPGQSMADLQVQQFHGKPVLTWWQGNLASGQSGVDYIADEHYQIIATIPAGPAGANIHEFRLTDNGEHAWITIYQPITADLTAVGGAKDGTMYDAVVQEIDVATKKVLFDWHASQHVPITDSFISPNDTVDNSGGIYDPYHVNAISLAPDGHVVVSMRHTSTVYNLDPTTGAIDWQIGGKHSSFALGKGVQFSFQHDAEMPDATTLRLFNNNSDGQTTNGASSIEWIHLDTATHTTTLIRNQTHPGNVRATAMGNAQMLPNGDVFGSWGTGNHIAEFTPTGQMVYDVTLAPTGSYRAYYQPWTGEPIGVPEAVIGHDGMTIRAAWNGATRVVQWRVLHGSTAANLTPLTTTAWNGASTPITLPQKASGYYQVEALDSAGKVIGRSVPLSAE
ncbi:arylsulfotransferase family protein [uncultured Gordonia sp.]|uniref:arylsulfotransferase family protein n=1 Tax=uncultured Gordonia sp. TaxID=198437 RepID=UPI00258385E9|nr:arylsulfotransferase family protein [uncultured Gordonia sp.]